MKQNQFLNFTHTPKWVTGILESAKRALNEMQQKGLTELKQIRHGLPKSVSDAGLNRNGLGRLELLRQPQKNQDCSGNQKTNTSERLNMPQAMLFEMEGWNENMLVRNVAVLQSGFKSIIPTIQSRWKFNGFVQNVMG